MFENMLNHPNIHIMLNTDYKEMEKWIPYKKMIYTGPVDYFFNHCYGHLPYRSIEFKFQTFEQEIYQPTGTVNYPNDQAYTRTTEFKYLTGQKHNKTTVVFEYPKAEGDPYYPVPKPENHELYKKYQLLAMTRPDVYFSGRLATYKYYNMDQVVAQSLVLFKKIQSALAIGSNGHKVRLLQEPAKKIDPNSIGV
jgi:UDP-galactopyranose mutase